MAGVNSQLLALVLLLLFNVGLFNKCPDQCSSSDNTCIISKDSLSTGLHFNPSDCTKCLDTGNIFSLTVIEEQAIHLNISQFVSQNSNVYILTSSNERALNSCNYENFTKVFPSLNNSGFVTISNLSFGSHYFVLNSTECFYGLRFQVHVYKDNCTTHNELCSSNGQCIANETTSLYNCLCCVPYSGNFCDEYNGCYNHTCQNSATCLDIKNGVNQSTYDCVCLKQFTGKFCESCVSGYKGEFCNEDINECQTNNTICNYGNCTNLNGSFSCQCFQNVTGELCETDTYDNCASNLCSNVSTCVDQYGSYSCKCQLGYEGNFCEKEVNECDENKCFFDGTEKCIDQFRGYFCQCRQGFEGVLCGQVINSCQPNPCQNGGFCKSEINSYTCACQPGYAGKNCSEIANKCQVLNPCNNGAQCVRTGNDLKDYNCVCLPGWSGKNCSDEINRCNENPCFNNASCVPSFNNFTCLCDFSWTGRYCNINIDGCASSPCANHSQCIDLITDSDYLCVCSKGFTSKTCDYNINDCKNVTCNNGKCIDGINSYRCQCDSGWFGEFCDTNRDFCTANPCLKSSLCKNVNTTQGFLCQCLPGYTGLNCDVNIDDCVNQTCLNGGTCNDFVDFANCSCAPGYTGPNCEININECESSPCQNNATCKDFIDSFFCVCQEGFNGSLCENNINDCLRQPCYNNGTCIDQINDFLCNCSAGYVTKTCSLHRCDDNTTCVNNATCTKTNTSTGFECSCQAGFTGVNCESNINDCFSDPCSNNASCVDKVLDYECHCVFPFIGKNCNEHICTQSPCENNSTCSQHPDNYTCECQSGFNGRNCTLNINECLENSCVKDHTKECVDFVNDHKCICHEGYFGRFCNESKCSISNICNNGSCVMNNTNFYCDCLAGFAGQNCSENINDCVNISCGTGQCIDGINNYSCQCPTLKTGKFCEINLDFCSSSPCFNNATCINQPDNKTYKCVCGHPYKGEKCEIHPCNETSICGNGTCIKQTNDFSCKCQTGYTGKYCDSKINFCENATCQNDGVCISGLTNFTCECKQNFTGKFCETLIDYCIDNNCSNMSTCASNFKNKNYTCLCSFGYVGRFCDESICDRFNLCQNGGSCYITHNDTKCSCLSGFTSENCSEIIDNCLSNPCLNDGACINQINSYQCHCKSNYTGNNCDVFIGKCFEYNCQNNGKCIANSTASYCDCELGFFGEFCEHFKCPCNNNGRCARNNENSPVKCICRTNYTGDFCDTYIGDCHSNISLACSDELFCKEFENGFSCDCPPHLQGQLCDTSGSCRSDTCKNNGTCNSLSSSRHVCSCLHGFNGSQCQFDINDCSPNPCYNHGSCIEEGIGGSRCFCVNNFHGNFCEIAPASSLYPTSPHVSTIIHSSYQSIVPTFPLYTTTRPISSTEQVSVTTKLQPSMTQQSKEISFHTTISAVSLSNTTPRYSLLSRPSFSKNFSSTMESSTQLYTVTPTTLLSGKTTKGSFLSFSVRSVASVLSSIVTTPKSTDQQHSSSNYLPTSTSNFKQTGRRSSTVPSTSLLISGNITTLPIIASNSSLSQSSSSIDFKKSSISTSMIMSSPSPTAMLTTVRTENPSMSTTVNPYLNITCENSPCNGFPCVNETDNGLNFRCECDYPTIGPVCSNSTVLQFARFSGYSHVIFPSIVLNLPKNILVVLFYMEESDGLIFYADHSLYPDYIKGELAASYFQVSMSFGASQVYALKSPERIARRSLIQAVISIDSVTGIMNLQINNSNTVSKNFQSSRFKQIDLNSNWYFGGRPGNTGKKFSGCIKDFQVNSQPIRLTDTASVKTWYGISECKSSACSKGVCLNGAECTSNLTNPDTYNCICREGYFGKTCAERNEFCIGNICNGGTCVWTSAGKECLCQYGKTGSSCLNVTMISIPRFSVLRNYSSYIEYPQLQTGSNATERFEIKLQFRIDKPYNTSNGQLIAFMGQSTIGASADDFFALGIHQGYVFLLYNLGNGLAVIRSVEKIPEDRSWHFLVAGRSLQHGYLYLNSQPKVAGTSPGVLTGLNIFTPLYIGGYPDFSKLPPILLTYFNQGFEGAIHDMAIRTNTQSFVPLLTTLNLKTSKSVIGIPVDGGRNIVDFVVDHCLPNPCANNGTCEVTGSSFTCKCKSPYQLPFCLSTNVLCVEYNPCAFKSLCRIDRFDVKCDCPFGYTGIFCTEKITIDVPYFDSSAYMSMPIVNIRSKMIILLKFKSAKENGLLFYVAHQMNENSGDFFAISFWKRFVYVKYNLGSHTISLKTRKQFSINIQHSLYIRQEGRTVIMILDNNIPVGVTGSSSTSKLDISQYVYLGGVPNISSVNRKAAKDINLQTNFIGSVFDLMVNSKPFILNTTNSVLSGRNVKNSKSHQCDVCPISALCDDGHSSTNITCECGIGYIGRKCDQAVINMTSALFNGKSYWYTRNDDLNTNSIAYSLKFKTQSTNATTKSQMILWHGVMGQNNNFLTVGMETNGYLNVTLSVDGIQSSKLFETDFADGSFHNVFIQRNLNSLFVTIDGAFDLMTVSTSTVEAQSYGYVYIDTVQPLITATSAQRPPTVIKESLCNKKYGGFPENTEKFSGYRYQSGFTGCISNVSFETTKKVSVNFADRTTANGHGMQLCN